jgi:hypothetical protein
MHLLFAISALCFFFFALVFTTIAITRHVRARRTATSPQPDFAQHLYAAAEDRNSRVPHPAPQQSVSDILAKKSWNRSSEMVTIGPDHHTHPSPSPKPF